MKPRAQANLEARRAELSKRIRASAEVNAMQSFCTVIACGFSEPPYSDGEPGSIEWSEQEMQQFMSDRAALLKRLESSGAGWFACAQEALAEALPWEMRGENDEWKAVLDSLGLSMQDLIREAIVAELVALKVAPAMHPVSAGGAA